MNNNVWHIISESHTRTYMVIYKDHYGGISIYIRYRHMISIAKFDIWSMIDRRNRYSGKLNFNYFGI